MPQCMDTVRTSMSWISCIKNSSIKCDIRLICCHFEVSGYLFSFFGLTWGIPFNIQQVFITTTNPSNDKKKIQKRPSYRNWKINSALGIISLHPYSGTYFLPSFPFTELWIFGNLNDIWALAPELKIPFINVKGGIDWMCISAQRRNWITEFLYMLGIPYVFIADVIPPF